MPKPNLRFFFIEGSTNEQKIVLDIQRSLSQIAALYKISI